MGRPTTLHYVPRFSQLVAPGVKVYLKREDLAHTGAHKINNALGQGLLAKRMGKKRIIAETGAGQHGVATATVCAMLGLECIVYMGEVDIQRQSLNVFRMKLLGAEVRPVTSGSRTLKDAINEAIRDWVTNVETTFYLIGSAVGPHPYPRIVRDFQSVIGIEARTANTRPGRTSARYRHGLCRWWQQRHWHVLPFRRYARSATDRRRSRRHELGTGKHAATLVAGKPGVLHGALSYLLQNDDGQIPEYAQHLSRTRLSRRRA